MTCWTRLLSSLGRINSWKSKSITIRGLVFKSSNHCSFLFRCSSFSLARSSSDKSSINNDNHATWPWTGCFTWFFAFSFFCCFFIRFFSSQCFFSFSNLRRFFCWLLLSCSACSFSGTSKASFILSFSRGGETSPSMLSLLYDDTTLAALYIPLDSKWKRLTKLWYSTILDFSASQTKFKERKHDSSLEVSFVFCRSPLPIECFCNENLLFAVSKPCFFGFCSWICWRKEEGKEAGSSTCSGDCKER